MKILLLLSFLLLTIHDSALSQLHYIAGTVKDELGKPLSGVEVFLSGTSRLAVTDDEGSFNIARLSTGNYELVAKLLGRETYTANFTLSKPSSLNIILKLKSRDLAEVVIRAERYSDVDYKTFIRTFLGVTPNAAQCKILNPKILNIYRDPETKALHVNSGGEFLIISNPALGYTVNYLLDEFILDHRQQFSMYVGQVLFSEMKGSASSISKWNKERNTAYLGSPQHLLNSIYHGNLKPQGFLVRKLLLTPNKESMTEKEYAIKQDLYKQLLVSKTITKAQHSDSSRMILKRARLPALTLGVGADTLEANAIIADHSGSNKQLNLSEPLHILYLREEPSERYHTVRQIEGTKKTDSQYQTSTVASRQGFLPISDSSGNLLNPLSVIFDGYMGWERVAEMLPKDFNYKEVK